jgi:hypothetical protein
LAKHYGIDPDVFLAKPVSRIARHFKWTQRLVLEKRELNSDSDS